MSIKIGRGGGGEEEGGCLRRRRALEEERSEMHLSLPLFFSPHPRKEDSLTKGSFFPGPSGEWMMSLVQF